MNTVMADLKDKRLEVLPVEANPAPKRTAAAVRLA